jgi:dTMP kinase
MAEKGLFIAFEGIDGSGKSTQAKLLASRLSAAGHRVHLTFEPTDNHIGSMIRDVLKGKETADERVIAGLFVADRLDHLLNESYGMLKKLEEGYIVITDRYYFSSYAYHGTHMDMEWVIDANSMSASILRPTVNFFIDVPVEVSMQRILRNREHVELYETSDNLKLVREKYLEAFAKLSNVENIQFINGNQTTEQISEDIFATVMTYSEIGNTRV